MTRAQSEEYRMHSRRSIVPASAAACAMSLGFELLLLPCVEAVEVDMEVDIEAADSLSWLGVGRWMLLDVFLRAIWGLPVSVSWKPYRLSGSYCRECRCECECGCVWADWLEAG